jgi:drug/metabolite transporter (DMT)-like permease
MSTYSSTLWYRVALVLATACWGTATVISKAALSHLPPLTLLVIQLIASVAFLWALLLIQRKRLVWNKHSLRAGLLGWLNPGFAYTFSLWGLAYTTASMSTLLWATEPILILGLASLTLRERLTTKLVLLSLLAVAGVLLIAGTGPNAHAAQTALGNGLILAGVVCCAVYTILARSWGTEVDSLALVTLQQTFALLWALAIWPVELHQVGREALNAIPARVWGWAVGSGLLYYALAFWFYLVGLKHIPASQASLFLNLIPIFGVSAGYLALGERLSTPQLLGAALILAATAGIFIPAVISPQPATRS